MEEKTCKRCGAKLPSSVKFCTNCGFNEFIDAQIPAPAPAASVQTASANFNPAPAPSFNAAPAPASAYYSAVPPVEPPKKKKNGLKIALIIIGCVLVLGAIGLLIDHFTGSDKATESNIQGKWCMRFSDSDMNNEKMLEIFDIIEGGLMNNMDQIIERLETFDFDLYDYMNDALKMMIYDFDDGTLIMMIDPDAYRSSQLELFGKMFDAFSKMDVEEYCDLVGADPDDIYEEMEKEGKTWEELITDSGDQVISELKNNLTKDRIADSFDGELNEDGLVEYDDTAKYSIEDGLVVVKDENGSITKFEMKDDKLYLDEYIPAEDDDDDDDDDDSLMKIMEYIEFVRVK